MPIKPVLVTSKRLSVRNGALLGSKFSDIVRGRNGYFFKKVMLKDINFFKCYFNHLKNAFNKVLDYEDFENHQFSLNWKRKNKSQRYLNKIWMPKNLSFEII
ncbi:hypothetical protein BpHYR1_040817 [Brachionus plicatilis]|uniref:Uncharacterized protein n=1 Tax=Brachionus plicatilis TaxID=10195 RepID=A0A3M7RDP6_BRAPC|nr:hypothetical protein BpHYR1_040817 [Brachionus plicatilis]